MVIWNDSPRMQAISARLEALGLNPGERGKGRNVWFCLGYTIACQDTAVAAIHDCDILTYEREMLARAADPINLPAVEAVNARKKRVEPGLSGHVLVVDDQRVNLKIVTRMLEKLGLSSDAVDNGEAAVSKVDEGGYDCVLMDVQMPEMTGLEATKRIRALPSSASDTIIIALTAMANVGDRETCLESGMNDYIAKPVRAKELGERLAAWLTNA